LKLKNIGQAVYGMQGKIRLWLTANQVLL
jgi:hypothetical protein